MGIRRSTGGGGRTTVRQGSAPSIRRAEFAGKDRDGLIARSLPRWVPFAPAHVQEGRHRGRCLFFTQQQIVEFVAQWNDSDWAETFGDIAWNPSDLPD